MSSNVITRIEAAAHGEHGLALGKGAVQDLFAVLVRVGMDKVRTEAALMAAGIGPEVTGKPVVRREGAAS